ncbi:MAG TPA: 50S ribosomal protein L30 [Armatimonadota bacterium]|jgi:large subunit ribosomal protein L30
MAKELIVKQTGSTIGAQLQHKRTIRALGLGKLNRTRRLPDNPAVRGMLHHVRHLVEVTTAE